MSFSVFGKLLRLCTFACLALGQAPTQAWAQAAETAAALRAACERNDARACRTLGAQLIDPRNNERNPIAGLSFYNRACDLNDFRACGTLAAELVAGPNGVAGVTRDLTRAYALADKSCTGNSGNGCTILGAIQKDGLGGYRKDPVAAARLFEKACTLKYALGCSELGKAYGAGEGVARDPVRAASYARLACELDKSRCQTRNPTASAPAPPQSQPPAADPTAEQCRQGAIGACMSFAGLNEITEDWSTALWAYDRACGLGSPSGCAKAAEVRKAQGMPPATQARPTAPSPASPVTQQSARSARDPAQSATPRAAAAPPSASGTATGREPQLGDAKCRNNRDRKDAALSCLFYGSIHSTPVNAQMGPSWPTALWYYDRACMLGDRKGCSEAAIIRREQPSLKALDPQVLLAPKAAVPQRQAAPVATQRARSAREPVAAGSLLARGIALHREKDFQPALALFLAAAKADPDDPRVYAYLASTYDWLGMSVESRMAAESARRIDPDALSILSR